MRRDALTYFLPEALIASRPADPPESARLLVLGEESRLEHLRIADLPGLLPEGALVVVNDTRVLPARLVGAKLATGGRAELLLVRRIEGPPGRGSSETQRAAGVECWRAIGRASKGLPPGTQIGFSAPGEAGLELVARVLDADFAGEGPAGDRRTDSGADSEPGALWVSLEPRGEGGVSGCLERVGRVPLPPYIRRPDDAEDRIRYQTAFARVPGAVAAPTAGLHITPALLSAIEARPAAIARVTLHVGLGTFKPVVAEDLDEHPMHAESFDVSGETAAAIAAARARGAPVVAVGTTVVRALESAADPERPGLVRSGAGETRLLIQPGYAFRVVDALLTNFHLPESTLLALVSALAGRERVLAAYAEAVSRRYRFFSYGDAMWIPPGARARSREALP